jgi:hypothetical protein
MFNFSKYKTHLLFSMMIGFFCFGLNAQEVKLVGKVTDSLNIPLAMASVIAKEKETKKVVTYSITNDDGLFQIKLPKYNIYNIEITFLGKETLIDEINTNGVEETIRKDFIMKEQSNTLKDVELVYEMPVSIKGDTIVYNADSFSRGDEEKLGDIIKNLPGMDINEDGEIEVEGKAVQKVMVEGKDFFDGDSKLAAKNIPSDAVSKVEVLRNFNEVDQMRGLGNDQDNVAVNIKLKEGKKKFWFGEVNTGMGYGGDEVRYIANPKLFYYSPKYSINILSNFNNSGESVLSFRDYFKFTGGFRNFNSKGGTRFNISDSGLGFLLRPTNQARLIENDFVATNFSYNPNKKWSYSGFGIFSGNRTGFETDTRRQFIGTTQNNDNQSVENLQSITNQENRLGLFKLSTTYKPNLNFQLDYDALIKISDQAENANQLSQFINIDDSIIDNNITERKDNQPNSVNQNINAYYTLDENNVFAGQAQYLYQKEDPFYQAILDFLPFAGILNADPNQSNFNINQSKMVTTNKVDAMVDYYKVLTKKSNINFSLGVTHSNQSFNSNIFQILDNGNRIHFVQTPDIDGDSFSLVNDVNFRFTDAFIGARYKFVKGNFTATPGVTLHNFNLSTDQLGFQSSLNEWQLLPEVLAIYNFRRTESLRFNYAMTAEYTDVNNYAEAFVFNNYNSLFRGNRALENAIANTYTLSYFNFNMFNYVNINANLNYTKRINGIKSDAQILAINQVSTPFNISSNFPDETFSAFGSFSKRFKKIQLEVSSRFNYSDLNNQFNDEIQNSESFTQNYQASLRTNFKKGPNVEVGYNYTRNRYTNANNESTFLTDRPFVELDYQFLKSFTLEADYNYFNYRDTDNTISNEYAFLNSSLSYQKPDSKWEFSVEAQNLLDVKTINNDSFSENFNTTNEYLVLPRIIGLRVRYEF